VYQKDCSQTQRQATKDHQSQQGLDWEEIEIIVTRILTEFGDEVDNVDFIVDTVAVAEMAQPETDKLLTKLK